MNSLNELHDGTSSWEKRFDVIYHVLWTISLPFIFISGPVSLTKTFTENIWAPLVAITTGLILYVILFKLVHKFRDGRWIGQKMEILVIGSTVFWSVVILKFIATNLPTDQNNEWGIIHSMVAIAVILIAISVRVMYYLKREYTFKDLIYKLDLLAFIVRSAFIIFNLCLMYCFWATWLIWFPVILAIGLCAAVYSISKSHYNSVDEYPVVLKLAIIFGIVSTVWQLRSSIIHGIGYAFTAIWNWIVNTLVYEVQLGDSDIYDGIPLWFILLNVIALFGLITLLRYSFKRKRKKAEERKRTEEAAKKEQLRLEKLAQEDQEKEALQKKEEKRQDDLEKKVNGAAIPSWIDIFDSKRRFSREVLVKASLIELVEISHTKRHLKFENILLNALKHLNTIAEESFDDQVLRKIVEQFANFNESLSLYKEYKGYDSLYRELSKNEDIMLLLERSKEVKETPVAPV